MHWKLQYQWVLYRITGKETERLERCKSQADSIKAAKNHARRMSPNQIKQCKWRKIDSHTYRLTQRGAYFRMDLEILGWTPPRPNLKPPKNQRMRELWEKRNKG